MLKTIIAIAIRSEKPVENEPGIFDYTYKIIKGIRAEVRQKRHTFSNADGINMQTTVSTTLSILFKNDKTDRAGRITHALYRGNLYEVSSVEQFPPRVNLILGDDSKLTLLDLGE